jgi:hypothetical protein
MHQGNRPRDLRDISHLYLSKKNEKGEAAAGSIALVLAASLGGGPLRAWLSSGLAVAFGSQNIAVTLLDTGPGLPNAGYYFALEPDHYLRPVLDEKAVVEIDAGRGVRVLSTRDPDILKNPGNGYAGGTRILLIAFEWPGSVGAAGLRGLPGLREDLSAFLLTVSDYGSAGGEGILRAFEELFPGGPALALFPGEGKTPAGSIEPCPFPVEMLEGLSRRKPPVSTFLTGLAGEILQRLGSRKKGAVRGGI